MKRPILLFLGLGLGLVGCGSDSTDTSPVQLIPELKVMDGMDSIYPHTYERVNLAPYIQSHDAQAQLISVFNIEQNPACGVPEMDGLGFYTEITQAALCHYQYEVQTIEHQGTPTVSDSAVMSVISSSTGEPILLPLSKAYEDGQQDVIQLEAEVTNYPDGYVLNDASLEGVGSINTILSENIITYSTDGPGYAQIIYTLEAPQGEAVDTKVGSIDIAVSNSLNTPPQANNATYNGEPETHTQIEIDVFPYVTVTDGDDIKLVNVTSSTADVVIKGSPGDSSTVFLFEAPVSGEHYVSYTVSDSNGGMDSAILEVNVVDPTQTAQWEYLVMSDGLYSAPLTSTEALEQNIQFTGNHYDGGYQPAISMATFNYEDAKGYCSTMGTLPTSAQLSALYHHHDPDNQSWPTELEYLTDDSGTPMAIDFVTGNITSARAEQGYYVTCNTPGNLTITTVNGTAVADGLDEATVEVTAMMDFDGGGFTPVADVVIDASVDGSAQLNESSVPTDSNGKALFEVTNYKAESVNVTAMATDVSSRAQSVSATVEFIGDLDTAEITKLEVIKDFSLYIPLNLQPNMVEATVTDANLNPVRDAFVYSSSDRFLSSTKSPSGGLTTEDGTVIYEYRSSVRHEVNVTLSHTSVDVGTTSLTEMITFLDLSGPYLDILEADSGKVFTNSPSVPYLDSIGGSANNGIFVGMDELHSPDGSYYMFDWYNANALCATYNTNSIGGRTNWRLPTLDELTELYDEIDSLYFFAGWPARQRYWTVTPSDSFPEKYMLISLDIGNETFEDPDDMRYGSNASCVSNP